VLMGLKIAMLSRGVRQTRMAVDLGWDPAKLSRIVNQIGTPKDQERRAIADYLGEPEAKLFKTVNAANPEGAGTVGTAQPMRRRSTEARHEIALA
jgi:transcriptional regulator with XRE-family HTH domain